MKSIDILMLWSKKKFSSEFLRFLAVGMTNTLLGYVIYLIFNSFIHYTYAYSFSYVIGIVISFVLNTRFVFSTKPSIKKFIKFPLVYVFQYLFGITMMILFVEKMYISAEIAPILIVFLSVPITFFLSRLVLKNAD